MSHLFSKLQRAVRKDRKTIWSDVVSAEAVDFVEDVLGFALPKVLRRAYMEISNGGFGPDPIIGLPGGYESDFGDLLKTWELFQEEEKDWEEGWLPIIHWGCLQLSIIDCDNDFLMVTRYDLEYYPQDYSFDTLLERWIGGEWPNLDDGGFHRP